MKATTTNREPILNLAERGTAIFPTSTTPQSASVLVKQLEHYTQGAAKQLALPYSLLRILHETETQTYSKKVFTYSEIYAKIKNRTGDTRKEFTRFMSSLSTVFNATNRAMLSFSHQFDQIFNPTHPLTDLVEACTKSAVLQYVTITPHSDSGIQLEHPGLFSFILHTSNPLFINGKEYTRKQADILLSGDQMVTFSKDIGLLEYVGKPTKDKQKVSSKREALIIEPAVVRITKPTNLLIYTMQC